MSLTFSTTTTFSSATLCTKGHQDHHPPLYLNQFHIFLLLFNFREASVTVKYLLDVRTQLQSWALLLDHPLSAEVMPPRAVSRGTLVSYVQMQALSLRTPESHCQLSVIPVPPGPVRWNTIWVPQNTEHQKINEIPYKSSYLPHWAMSNYKK